MGFIKPIPPAGLTSAAPTLCSTSKPLEQTVPQVELIMTWGQGIRRRAQTLFLWHTSLCPRVGSAWQICSLKYRDHANVRQAGNAGQQAGTKKGVY